MHRTDTVNFNPGSPQDQGRIFVQRAIHIIEEAAMNVTDEATKQAAISEANIAIYMIYEAWKHFPELQQEFMDKMHEELHTDSGEWPSLNWIWSSVVDFRIRLNDQIIKEREEIVKRF